MRLLNNCFLRGRGLIETAIGELKEICQIQRHGIACQTISCQASSQGSWLMSSNPIYLMEK
ncbi:MAG: transposase [Candidatus Midichloria mitochondrii]|nr:transposase [Candidatus Midichloria mitochondrii]